MRYTHASLWRYTCESKGVIYIYKEGRDITQTASSSECELAQVCVFIPETVFVIRTKAMMPSANKITTLEFIDDLFHSCLDVIFRVF